MATKHSHDHDHDHDHGSDLARIEALVNEGVHRAGDHEGPFSLHIVGLGATGAGLITALLENRPAGFLADESTRFTALAVDIGNDADLAKVRAAATDLPASRAQVRTVEMPTPTRQELSTALNRYREFLKMEYPRYYWNPNYEPWLPADVEIAGSGEHFSRAVAKAIYGAEYYQNREIARELDAFAESVNASESTPIVVVAFGLAGGVGSGVVVELARHLSTIKLGRRPWVVGVGVLPCDGDPDELLDGSLFPVINELDCMIDTAKNDGVMAVWGDLYKNPFTGGFLAVPQNDVYEATGDLATTHKTIDEGIADFLARDGSVHLYETLKALNWLAVPGDQWHPAIRGQQDSRWLNMLSVRKLGDVDSLGTLGLNKGFTTEYAEARLFGPKKETGKIAKSLGAQVSEIASTPLDPNVLTFDTGDSPLASVVVPRASKLDLAAFVPSREKYDTLEWDEKLLMHSWLLDLGVMLCEPSIRFDGMGGECIWGCACWVVVPHAAIRGEQVEPPAPAPVALS